MEKKTGSCLGTLFKGFVVIVVVLIIAAVIITYFAMEYQKDKEERLSSDTSDWDTEEVTDELSDQAEELEDNADESDADTDKDYDVSLVSDDVKKACDEYEEFIDKYIEVMESYANDPTNEEIISEYTEYMNQYNDTTTAFEQMDSESMNEIDRWYYAKVQIRCSEKLLKASTEMSE